MRSTISLTFVPLPTRTTIGSHLYSGAGGGGVEQIAFLPRESNNSSFKSRFSLTTLSSSSSCRFDVNVVIVTYRHSHNCWGGRDLRVNECGARIAAT